MKNIRTLCIILVVFGCLNPAFSQVDENGRTREQLAKKQTVIPNANPTIATPRNEDDYGDDGEYEQNENTETIDITAMSRQLQDLEMLVNHLMLQNEQLSAEILAANRKSDLCCSASSKNLTSGGYLLQNAPNPFSSNSNITYTLPESFSAGQINIRTLDGKIVQSHRVASNENGSLNIAAENLEPGTYVYSLVVDGAVVDTKIMILTK